jgi:hypothetical protein
MKKFLNWVLNHLKTVLAIVTFTTTIVVIGVVMLNSYNSYKAYEAEYYESDLVTRSEFPPAPKGIFLDNGFSSKYKNVLVGGEDELVVSANKVEFSFNLSEKSFVDIKFYLDVNYVVNSQEPEEVKDLLAKANFKVDDNLMEGEINVLNNDESILIMSGFALKKGDHVITVEGKNIVNLTEVVVYSSVVASLVE